MSDLQEKLSIPGELQNVRVLHSVSTDPDIFFVVDEHAMLGVRPLALGTWPSPSWNDTSGRIGFGNRRRRRTAIGLRWIGRSIFVVVVQTSWSRRNPEMIV